MMIVHKAEQGSPEWFANRAGVITGSMFPVIRAKVGGLSERQKIYVDAILAGRTTTEALDLSGYKSEPKAEAVGRALKGLPVGEWSKPAMDYAFKVAVERISGEPIEGVGYETPSMRRGKTLEAWARIEHEAQSGLIVDEADFVTDDERIFGCSADGLIGEDEGAEYKCFTDPSKVRSFWLDNDASIVFDQAQGGMWITGRKRWHIGMYCPALESVGKQLWWTVIDRDESFIREMEIDLRGFAFLVDEYEAKLRG